MSGTVYAESSGVLAWLLGEDREEAVGEVLAAADGVVASDLTVVECERVLIRGWSTGVLSEAAAADCRAMLSRASRRWTMITLSEAVVERARRPFPIEPVRTLDALHLSCALVARGSAPGLAILTLDQRVLENAERLGFDVAP